MHLADGSVTGSGQVCHFDCQPWGIQAKAGGLAGEDLGKCSSCNALLVLIHAAVKQKPGRQEQHLSKLSAALKGGLSHHDPGGHLLKWVHRSVVLCCDAFALDMCSSEIGVYCLL